ncbi:MAG: hypothetical protein F4110_07630 [Acidimicrobiaceae bacterium]|nr:hypothetical protein [Acidimicrobiaceae bacterium]MYE97048.1 hypothetical protein [Acidimicrobiaceae bacterium]MYI53833.1 hypothetical protein [Acidimicrobiaceae bacterium]
MSSGGNAGRVPSPASLYDREAEWDDLVRFVSAPGPKLRLGLLYGRRRYGKSYLLRRLVESVGGLYHLALQEERRTALEHFADTVGRHQPGVPPLRFDDWTAALGYAIDALGREARGPRILVLDEYPYLRQGSSELDSCVQALMDEAAGGSRGSAWEAPVSVIVCGSAMSVMTGILSGSSPMRGRAALDMVLAPFDFRQARGFWGMANPAAALGVDAVVGGAAGYKDLTAAAGVPEQLDQLADWLYATVLNPSHALFREDEYLLREDPRVTVEAPYYSLLQAIAAGRASQGRIAETVGRAPADIMHQLNVMTTAGFVVRDDDLLTARRPAYRIADPIVRFHHLVTRRSRAMLEERRFAEVWAAAANTYRSQIVGPHFESLCRRWVDSYASDETLGGPVSSARRVQVNDRRRRQSFELDVAAASSPAAAGARRQTRIQVLGEAKASRLGAEDLVRLDRVAGILDGRKAVSLAPEARRLLFSMDGFSTELEAVSRRRADVELIDLDRLYEGA